jgi:demethylmenaquinone methyltransferase/2-methoxy-6-polyprenyl-1,4-benzoquinol methylase
MPMLPARLRAIRILEPLAERDYAMSRVPVGNPSPPETVRRMFARIAARYDVMNTLMTAGLDARWRRAAVAAAGLAPGMRVLDLACGTGMLARAAAAAVGHRGEVVGVDAVPAMLDRARRVPPQRGAAPIRWENGDALALSGDDAGFDAVLIGFGLRNLSDYGAALREMARVTRPGGRVVVLEIATPRARLPRMLYGTWFRRVVPALGGLVGRGTAYTYLPASLDTYPPPEVVAELMAAAGLGRVRWRWLTGGMTTLHVGEGAA